ncbi:hypothetical protein OBP_071 [Pseudomonas phage OBP]|uniref:hypothetical protein n=1 Tax=Pseudomonas phage OBP TaxID=1124849 RepID=UPI000240D425|nr:hypothetical protein OBP_071 [Pseudomonas phage OBP]AEV89508.1 hypothetical protein OBP_071 [Pseudomonas phage OBP]
MNKLNKLYEAMLKSWGCTLSADAAISLNFSGTVVPVTVEEKQVYLATSENLNGVTIGKVFFHPACESIMSKETEIFKVIRKLSTAKIYAVFQPICEVLFAVAGKKSGKTLTGKMMEMLEPFKTVTKAVKQEVLDIIKTISVTIEDQNVDTRLISFNLMKGGKTENDEPIYYTATPSFPFYTELYRTAAQNEHLKAADRLSFNGLSVSMQAMRVVIALFEIAIPAVIDPARHKYAATTQDAARLTAYLHSYGLVVSDMNSLIGKFRKEFDAIGIYGIDIDWLSELDEISEIKKLIPALDYNNYNMGSAPEAPAANSGARISSYNPVAGMFNSSSQSNINQGSANTIASAPKIPDAMPGENYIGCDYSQANGIYEYKFQCNNGLVRVRRLAEDGRFISEDFQNPMMTNMNGMNNNGVPPLGMGMPNMMMPGMANPMMMNMMGSGIPMFGMGQPGMGAMVRDPYTGQMVMAGNNQAQNNGFQQPQNNGIQWNTGIDLGSTAGINDY